MTGVLVILMGEGLLVTAANSVANSPRTTHVVESVNFDTKLHTKMTPELMNDALIAMSSPSGIQTKLSKKILDLYQNSKEVDEGAAYVVYAPPGTGKTHSAASLLRHVMLQSIPHGMLLTGQETRVDPYQHVMAKALGAPSASKGEFSWVQTAVATLGGAEKSKSIPAQIWEMVTNPSIWSDKICGNNAHELEETQNKTGECPPVLILDDVNSILGNDIAFLNALAKEACRRRVLMFVLSNKKEVASRIVDEAFFLLPLPRLMNSNKEWSGSSWNRHQLTLYLESGPKKKMLRESPDLYEEVKNQKVLRMAQYGMTPFEANNALAAETSEVEHGVSESFDMLDSKTCFWKGSS